jgi:hypothetical protein
MTFRRFFVLLSLFSAAFLGWPSEAMAIFELSVSPRRGGQNIRFSAEGGSLPVRQAGASGGEGLQRNEEVTVAVVSDRAAQYRILQTLYQPLTNEFGNTIPPNAFIQFSPSNPLGTLRTQLETPISMGQKQIYISNIAGDSDDFVLVFNVRIPENQQGGVYHTQLTFTAELVNAQGGVSPSTRTLDVRVEVNPKFSLALQNAKGSRVNDFGNISKERAQASEVLNLQIDSNIGTRYRLLMQLTEPPVSSEGETLTDAITFQTRGNAPTALSESPALVYQSNEWGAGENVELEFFLNPSPTQKAGIYTGSLSFRVESSSPFVPGEVIIVPIKVNIESVFSLETQMEQGGNMNFGTFKTGQEKQEKSVLLRVRSNLGQPYQIMQMVPRKMTNAEGGVIPKQNFVFFGANAKTGVLAVPAPTPVEEGNVVVFTSDKKGTPEEFVLNYLLTIPPDTRAGSYSSELKYSITTL